MKQYLIVDWYKKAIVNEKLISNEQEAKATAFDYLVANAKQPGVVPDVRVEVKTVEW